MKKITIELDDRYGNILTFTAVGSSLCELNVTTCAVDITKHNRIVVGHDGKPALCEE